jgi:flagella basal body P-ring formation protein FlgA
LASVKNPHSSTNTASSGAGRLHRHRPWLAGLAWLVCASASAQPVLDPTWVAQAQQAAQDAARAAFGNRVPVRVEVEAGTLDPRLQLAPCARVEVFLPPGQRAWGRTRMGLKCAQGAAAWRVTVPMTVRLWAPGLVVAASLPAGTVLAPGHLKMAEVDWSERDSPVLVNEPATLGRTLGLTLSAGAALRQEHLRKRQWFESGDTVRLTAVGPGFSIQGEGVALNPGVEGQSVRIRTESGRTVTGTPTGLRQVEITL